MEGGRWGGDEICMQHNHYLIPLQVRWKGYTSAYDQMVTTHNPSTAPESQKQYQVRVGDVSKAAIDAYNLKEHEGKLGMIDDEFQDNEHAMNGDDLSPKSHP